MSGAQPHHRCDCKATGSLYPAEHTFACAMFREAGAQPHPYVCEHVHTQIEGTLPDGSTEYGAAALQPCEAGAQPVEPRTPDPERLAVALHRLHIGCSDHEGDDQDVAVETHRGQARRLVRSLREPVR